MERLRETANKYWEGPLDNADNMGDYGYRFLVDGEIKAFVVTVSNRPDVWVSIVRGHYFENVSLQGIMEAVENYLAERWKTDIEMLSRLVAIMQEIPDGGVCK